MHVHPYLQITNNYYMLIHEFCAIYVEASMVDMVSAQKPLGLKNDTLPKKTWYFFVGYQKPLGDLN